MSISGSGHSRDVGGAPEREGLEPAPAHEGATEEAAVSRLPRSGWRDERALSGALARARGGAGEVARREPTVGLEYGVMVPDRPAPAVGLEYGVFVPDLPEPTVGLEYGVFVPDRPPAPTVGLEYGVFVPDVPEPTVGLEYGVFVPDRPAPRPPAPSPRPPPGPSVGLEYGVFVPDVPEPTVGLEYGVFVPDRPPAPTVGLEYGVFVPDRPPAPTVGLEYGVMVPDTPAPTVGLEYGVFVPDRPATGAGEGAAIARRLLAGVRAGDYGKVADALTDMGVPDHGPGVHGQSMGRLSGDAAVKRFNDTLAGLGGSTLDFLKKAMPDHPLRMLNLNRMVQEYGTPAAKKEWNTAMAVYMKEIQG